MDSCKKIGYLKLIWPLFFLTLHLAVSAPFLFAQEIFSVTAEGKAPLGDGDKTAAKSRAVENALRNAVHAAVGSSISTRALVVNFRHSGSILGSIPYGKVVDKKILEESIEKIMVEGQKMPSLVYNVKIRAGVVGETSGADPSFRLDARLNNTNFINGDEMLIRVKPAKDCYIYVFNILGDEKVLQLIPSRLKKQNFLPANTTFLFPSKADRRRGLKKIRVHLPKNKDVVTESIYILALRRPFKFDSASFQEGIFGIYNGQTAFVKELIKEIVGIPLNERSEALMQYEIRKK